MTLVGASAMHLAANVVNDYFDESSGVDTAARTDPSRNAAWHFAFVNRNKAAQLPEVAGQTDRYLLQGSLFYSRECKDRNLPEEERR